MKALKSKLAEQLLSDPRGKEQLRSYLANKGNSQSINRDTSTGRFIEVTHSGQVHRVKATVVPKAA